nr:DUF6693 family protein [uncultured Cohaesibacter sp.]
MQSLKCEMELIEGIGLVVLWVVLSFITFGLALFVMPYYLTKAPINRTFVVDDHGNKIGRLYVDFTLAQIVGHAVIWLLLSIVTFGIAYIVYWFAVFRKLLNASVIQPVQSSVPTRMN